MSNDTLGEAPVTKEEFVFATEPLPEVTPVEMIVEALVTIAIFLVISQRAYAYIARGGKGSIFRTVLCLWLLSAMRFLFSVSAFYLVWMHESQPHPRPQISFQLDRKSIGAFVSFVVALLFIYGCVTFVVWKQIYTMTGRRKLSATMLTALLWIPSFWINDYQTEFVLTHLLIITQIGLHGTPHALILPNDEHMSDCPRLRMPSRLRTFAHAQERLRWRGNAVAAVICAVNVLAMYILLKANNYVQGMIPGGPYIPLSEAYTIIYLNIKIKHASVGSGRDVDDAVHEHVTPPETEASSTSGARARTSAQVATRGVMVS